MSILLPESVTIREASQIIGVSERSLRRYLAAPGNAAVTRQVTRRETRQTRTGPRIATVLLTSELPRIRELLIGDASSNPPSEERRQEHGGNAGKERGNPPPLPPFQDALIAELRSQIEAKDREMRERLEAQAETIEDLRRTKDALLERLSESEARLALVLAATDRLQIAASEGDREKDEPERNGSDGGGSRGGRKPIWGWWKRNTTP